MCQGIKIIQLVQLDTYENINWFVNAKFAEWNKEQTLHVYIYVIHRKQ